jgi:hypothetical protein
LNCGIIERVREIEGKEGHTHRLIKRYTVTNWGIHTRERTHRDKNRRNRKKETMLSLRNASEAGRTKTRARLVQNI